MPAFTDALPGEATIFEMLTTPPSTFTAIGNLNEIDGFEMTADPIDKFGLGDVIKKRRKSLLIDPGTISFTMRVDPSNTTHQAIYDKTVASDPASDDSFKIVFKDGNTTPANVTFDGFFTKYKLTGMKEGENVLVEGEIQVTTLPEWTEGITP